MKILLVVYDNDSYIHYFPQGLAYIASALRDAGHIVKVYSQDKFHYPDAHLTAYLDNETFDAVGVSVVGGYYQYRKLLRISDSINRSKKRPFYIIGGHGPSPEPEYFLKKTGADAAVIGEGEVTAVELLSTLAERKSLSGVRGVAFRDGEKIVINPRRALIKDIDNISRPAYDLFPVDYYRLMRLPHAANSDFAMSVLSGRGCTFKCNFCYRMDDGHRPRSTEGIIDEIKFLKHEYGINYIVFSDELLMTSVSRTVSLCEAFIRHKLNIKWYCNGRLNYAKPDVLKMLKRSGCVFVNYGIESFDDAVLKNMKKALTTDLVTEGIEATIKAGLSPGLNVIFGNIGDSEETLDKSVKFLLKYDDGAQLRTIRPVTPYPGSPLYYYAIEKGLLKGPEDFYENKHVNSDLLTVNFTAISDARFHRILLETNIKLLDNYFRRQLEINSRNVKNLYLNKDASFRGFRQT